MTDTELLEKKLCPDCGQPIRHYFAEIDKPWCKACNTYFTMMGNWVVRNPNATQEYNRLLEDDDQSE